MHFRSFCKLHTGILVDNEEKVDECRNCPMQLKEQIIDPKLLHDFVQEKLSLCRTFIFELKLDELRKELEKIFSYKIAGIEGVDKLLFYKLIINLHDGKVIESDVEGLSENLGEEYQWLINYYHNPVPITVYAFALRCPETQVMVLNKMFSDQLWENIVILCEEIIDDSGVTIEYVMKQYYGLALFNLQKYDKATVVLKNLYQKSKNESVLIYSIMAEIMNINRSWEEGLYESCERLKELINQLDTLRDNLVYKKNMQLIAALLLESSYNLGLSEKKYLDNVSERYQSFPEKVKNDATVKYLYALCLELNGNIDYALEIYSELFPTEDVNIACRYMICKLRKKEYSEVVAFYRELRTALLNTKLKSLYLTALFYAESEQYEINLKVFVDETKDSFIDFIDIAVGIREAKLIPLYITPVLKNSFLDNIENLGEHQKNEVFSILSTGREDEYILNLLEKWMCIKELNRGVIREIYEATFAVSNQAFISHEKTIIKSHELDACEKIADQFLVVDVSKKEFLQIKYLCAGAKEKRISMLKYAKELFEITNEEGLARNIVAMLFERNEVDYKAYAPYINVLRTSIEPDYCMAVASAMLRLGKNEEADFYAYKALYCLNDKEDYDIYNNYFGYHNYNLSRYQDENDLKRVKGNAVITLEECSIDHSLKPRRIELCLDTESEFSDINNMSMDIKHIPANSPLFLKIQGSSLNQVLKLNGINYKIVEICSRNVYAIRFIFGKISKHPERFNGAVCVSSTEKPEELIEKIRSMSDGKEHLESVLSLYHFRENNIGLPIDSFVNGNYDRYIDALNMLLYTKDQVLYTGFPTCEELGNHIYIPTLSTLVLLSSLNLLSVLSEIKDSLLIPASYKNFFSERYLKAKEQKAVSPGKIVSVDDQITFVENDSSQLEIWERIVDFCTICETVDVSDEERISFKIGDDIAGEQFFAMARIHAIHLDAFVLATKEQGVLLCDDLFFRKIATLNKIQSINFVSLLRYYDDEFAVPIILELSRTNYLYIPLIARTDEEATILVNNMLDGELKKKFYSDMLVRYNVALQKVMQEIFNNE